MQLDIMIGGQVDELLPHSQMKSSKKHGNLNRKSLSRPIVQDGLTVAATSTFFAACPVG
jgi:hypothetical protein